MIGIAMLTMVSCGIDGSDDDTEAQSSAGLVPAELTEGMETVSDIAEEMDPMDPDHRVYQNPPEYVQITNEIDTHGLDYYTAPVLVNSLSTKEDHIEALIETAFKYKGDPFVEGQSGPPGEGVDCSGLIIQSCYGAGVDLWPVNTENQGVAPIAQLLVSCQRI